MGVSAWAAQGRRIEERYVNIFALPAVLLSFRSQQQHQHQQHQLATTQGGQKEEREEKEAPDAVAAYAPLGEPLACLKLDFVLPPPDATGTATATATASASAFSSSANDLRKPGIDKI